MSSKQVRAKRQSLIQAFLIAGLILGNNSAQADDSSIIEQALDGKEQDVVKPVPATSNPEPVLEKIWTPEKLKKHSKKTQLSAGSELPGTPIPEPKDMMEAPIHSSLPASIPSVLGFQVGAPKIGKGFAVDPSYRGKPALSTQPTVSFGSVPWALPAKKQVATAPTLPTSPATPTNTAPVSNSQNKPANLCTINVRFQTPQSTQRKDSVWAYPYPPKPPKPSAISPLAEDEASLKNMILSSGYSYRPDLRVPYPSGGWRWIHAFETAKKKSGLGTPHTMLTMYQWTNKMFPYVFAECHELNLVEEQRFQRYEKIKEDYERIHTDLESQAASKGLFPLEIKINSRGIGQFQLPEGNWWITATRKTPGLKFYWQIPVSCTKDQTVNVQMTEANALIIAGGW